MGNCIKGLLGQNRTQHTSSTQYGTADVPEYHVVAGIRRRLNELTEEEQIEIASKLGKIDRLPTNLYTGVENKKECDICWEDYEIGTEIRRLPCNDFFHVACIDEWLMRDPSCPICRTEIGDFI